MNKYKSINDSFLINAFLSSNDNMKIIKYFTKTIWNAHDLLNTFGNYTEMCSQVK